MRDGEQRSEKCGYRNLAEKIPQICHGAARSAKSPG
jgi:hypothetical protein